MQWTGLLIAFSPDSSLRSAQKTEVLTSALGLLGHHVLPEVAWSKHIIMIMLCRLYSGSESRLMIRNNSRAAVPGLIVGDVNLSFACLVHNEVFLFSARLVSYCFCINRTLCPIEFWFPGHFVRIGTEKMCNTVISLLCLSLSMSLFLILSVIFNVGWM